MKYLFNFCLAFEKPCKTNIRLTMKLSQIFLFENIAVAISCEEITEMVSNRSYFHFSPSSLKQDYTLLWLCYVRVTVCPQAEILRPSYVS